MAGVERAIYCRCRLARDILKSPGHNHVALFLKIMGRIDSLTWSETINHLECDYQYLRVPIEFPREEGLAPIYTQRHFFFFRQWLSVGAQRSTHPGHRVTLLPPLTPRRCRQRPEWRHTDAVNAILPRYPRASSPGLCAVKAGLRPAPPLRGGREGPALRRPLAALPGTS